MRHLRISVAVITCALICIGVGMIYSASAVYALKELNNDGAYFLKRHLLFLSIGFLLAIAVMTIPYQILQKWAKPLLLCSVVLLILVLIPGIGKMVSGARRWIPIGPFSFQPSEFAKLTVIIYMADFLARKKRKIRDLWEGIVPVMIVLGCVSLLILKQPDLGTAVSIIVIVFMMLFVAGSRLKYLASIGLLALPVLYFLVVRVSYRRVRVMAFLDPWQDPQGIGFQLTQSQIALGTGKFFGVGLGKGIQKLFYLPAAHTDFIFSIIGEEFGLMGTFCVIALFVLLIWQGARIAKRTQEPFGYFLTVGLLVMIGFQAVVNIGVSIGMLPTKGLPLPFISYGGSALIINMIAIGLLLNISRMQEL